MDVATSLTLYKIVSLISGTIICYLGYLLFCKGVWGEAGDMKAKFGDNKLVLKSAAPGTFFVVLGTVVLLFTIIQGLELEKQNETNAGNGNDATTTSQSARGGGK